MWVWKLIEHLVRSVLHLEFFKHLVNPALTNSRPLDEKTALNWTNRFDDQTPNLLSDTFLSARGQLLFILGIISSIDRLKYDANLITPSWTKQYDSARFVSVYNRSTEAGYSVRTGWTPMHSPTALIFPLAQIILPRGGFSGKWIGQIAFSGLFDSEATFRMRWRPVGSSKTRSSQIRG